VRQSSEGLVPKKSPEYVQYFIKKDMLTFTLGLEYLFTLSSGRTAIIIIHGASASPNLGAWDISVDGKRGNYTDINQALGEPFVQVVLVH
jgi:hypothetical protein